MANANMKTEWPRSRIGEAAIFKNQKISTEKFRQQPSNCFRNSKISRFFLTHLPIKNTCFGKKLSVRERRPRDFTVSLKLFGITKAKRNYGKEGEPYR
jgi:hypothetical protein